MVAGHPDLWVKIKSNVLLVARFACLCHNNLYVIYLKKITLVYNFWSVEVMKRCAKMMTSEMCVSVDSENLWELCWRAVLNVLLYPTCVWLQLMFITFSQSAKHSWPEGNKVCASDSMCDSILTFLYLYACL